MAGLPITFLQNLDPRIIRGFYAALLQSGGILVLTLLTILLLRRIWRAVEEAPAPLQARGKEDAAGLAPRGRAVLWFGLAALWILDGLLQAQPAMASSMFVDMVFATVLQGQPAWYVRMMGDFIQFWTNHQMSMAVVAVYVQIGIGLLILVGKDKPSGRAGLWLSIVWGAGVWVFGEGFGGLLSGSATTLSGAPGAVLFYIMGAALLLAPGRLWGNGTIARRSGPILAFYWAASAFMQAVPNAGFWTGKGLSSIFFSAASIPETPLVAAPIQALAEAAKRDPVLWNATFVAVPALLAVLVLVRRARIPTLVLSGLWLLFSWWMGQDFGVIGGVGTDPNSSPVLALLMVSTWLLGAPLPEGKSRSGAGRRWGSEPAAQDLSNPDRRRREFALRSAASGAAGIVMLALGGAVAPPAQGDSQGQGITHSVSASSYANPSRWMSIDQAAREVRLSIAATSSSSGSLDINGYGNGFLTVTVPIGWRVRVSFRNEQALLWNSMMVVPMKQVQSGTGRFTQAFPGASTPDPTVGVPEGGRQSFSFIAARPGHYAFVSGVPDGQTQSGMWDSFVVSPAARKPSVSFK